MMRWIVTLLLFVLLVPVTGNATAQEPDTIKIGNKVFHLQTNPLDNYLKSIEWKAPEEAVYLASITLAGFPAIILAG